MLRKISFPLIFLLSACVTVNIYFPAAAVERAADQIVKETWGGPGEPGKKEQPRSSPIRPATVAAIFRFVDEAHAREADINVSNPAIRALKDSTKDRSDSIKPSMDRGNVGSTPDGLLPSRTPDG